MMNCLQSSTLWYNISQDLDRCNSTMAAYIKDGQQLLIPSTQTLLPLVPKSLYTWPKLYGSISSKSEVFKTNIFIKMLVCWVSLIIDKPSLQPTNSVNNSPLMTTKPCSRNPWNKCSNNLLKSFANGWNAVTNTWSSNKKLHKLAPNSIPMTFAHFLDKTSLRMISIHHRIPYYNAPVWVFCVRFSHRVITLKKRVFFTTSRWGEFSLHVHYWQAQLSRKEHLTRHLLHHAPMCPLLCQS